MRGALLVAGTGSDAGKSALVAGLCRWLAREGVSVAPFKAQNMSLNSFVTGEGAEIGRAQAMQAAAAGIEPTADMNPILLKPGSDRRSQVVVLGHPEAEADAMGYRAHAPRLRQVALASLDRLRARYDVVICEGAGSPAEINLRDTDVANMGLARAAGLPVVVVGDIDRGGVFAAMFGTLALLTPADQALIAGFVINKFRGAPELLGSGLTMLRELTGRPVYGVLPWRNGLELDAEDSLALSQQALSRGTHHAPFGKNDLFRVAVVKLPRISNFTDVDALAAEPGVLVRFADHPAELADADLVVLPGSRATVADLAWLRERGLAGAITDRARAGRPVLGICGGYQMLAEVIDDPVESRQGLVDGLGLLPVRVVFGPAKRLGRRPRVGRAGGRVRDPPRDRRGHRPGGGVVPGWLPSRCGVGDELARRAGERRVPPRVPGRGGGAGGPGLHARARDRLRRAAAGAAGRPGRPGRRSPRYRRAEQADRRRPAAGDAVLAGIAQPCRVTLVEFLNSFFRI
jgi:adenosylcobyric acid synthase